MDSLEHRLKKLTGIVPKPVQVKEKFGQLRYYTSNGFAEAQNMDQWKEFCNLINEAEAASLWICESCGSMDLVETRPNELDGFWIKTLCAKCRARSER